MTEEVQWPSWSMGAFPREVAGIVLEMILRQVLRDRLQGWKEGGLLREALMKEPQESCGKAGTLLTFHSKAKTWLCESCTLEAERQSQVRRTRGSQEPGEKKKAWAQLP